MPHPSPSIKEYETPYKRDYDKNEVTYPSSEYESGSEVIPETEPQQQRETQPQTQQVGRRQRQFKPTGYRSSDADLQVTEPRNRRRDQEISTVGPVAHDQDTPTEELTIYADNENQQLQKKDEDSGLKLRLDLNLDIEVELKARIHGDLTLSLLK
ncbi:hypothetical protein FE257_003071 [Aspergillus nanangensis]|uniref:Uncharacterized protein n=1 Tax=Aspergillus nanangensis TaxID=2582783 RepID=A0AAD4CCD2_ASPNN|nr:hypothetical protein FE257_003071 [Aspergillus nanangensis]